MKGSVTQNDVAKEAGVTRSMVSYVISGNPDRSVAPETRERILAAIEKLGYRPNKAAQALQQGDVEFASNKIGVILCNEKMFLRPYYAEILAGIHTRAHECNYHIGFIRFFDEFRDPVLFNNLIHQEEIGGLILLATDQCLKTDADAALIEKMKSRISRIVCVEWKYEGLSSVMFDRQETARKATEFLYRMGYTDIKYLGETDERVKGVENILELHALDTSAYFIGSAFDMNTGYEALKSYASRNSLPRAILCGSDEVAVGVMSALHELNVKIPEQVAIMSIDNLEISAFTNPPLTTMNVQKHAMGIRAVEMIVNDTCGKDDEEICIMLPAKIVERSSC